MTERFFIFAGKFMLSVLTDTKEYESIIKK